MSIMKTKEIAELNKLLPNGIRFTEDQLNEIIVRFDIDKAITVLIQEPCKNLPLGALAGPAPHLTPETWRSLSEEQRQTHFLNYGIYLGRKSRDGVFVQRENTDITEGNPLNPTIYLWLFGYEYHLHRIGQSGNYVFRVLNSDVDHEEPLDRSTWRDINVCADTLLGFLPDTY